MEGTPYCQGTRLLSCRLCSAATQRCAALPSQPIGARPGWPASREHGFQALREVVCGDEAIAPLRHSDRTLGVLAQRQAGNAEIGRFLLHAARIGRPRRAPPSPAP